MIVDQYRVLVLAPTDGDASLSASVLKNSGMQVRACRDLMELREQLGLGAGALLLTEEVLASGRGDALIDALKGQPTWSDIPILLLASAGADSKFAALAMDLLSNVTVLERPVRLTTLISALRTGIRSRHRQYQLRDQMEALRSSEERFHLVAQAGNDTLWDIDLASGKLWIGEPAHRMFYFATVPSGNNSGVWKEGIHPDDSERVDASFAAAIAGDGPLWSEEYRLRKRDGSYAHILNRGHIVRDANGVAVRASGAMMDITERKHSEELSARLAAIVESSEDAMVSKNLDGIITSWNFGAERLFGYGAEEAIGQHITLIIPLHLHEEERSILARLRQGRRIDHFESVRRTKDGRLIDISLSVSPIRDGSGRVIGAAKVARDITAQKLTEATLERQAERLRLLLEAASALLVSDAPDVMLKNLFARIAPHLELDVYFNFLVDEENGGLRLYSCTGIAPEDMQRVAHVSFGQAVCGNVALRREPIVASFVQHSEEPMVAVIRQFGIRAYACNPLIIDGRLIGTLSFASRRKDRFESDELEFIEIVCSYVTTAYDRVNLIGQLRETDRRKDEFLATLAHELRNPLAPIRNALQIMRLAGNDRMAKEQAQLMMERQLAQMVRLIDDLLDVSRITNGKLELRKEFVDLGSVVKNAIDTSRPLIEASQHLLTIELPEQRVMLHVDPVRMAQVLSNLLNNAAKYMDNGGRIWLTAALEEGDVVIGVRDTGMGIPADALASIFEMFTQVPHADTRAQGGLGIGLTLVKRLVELHKGSIAVHSEGIGKGAEFTLRLPVSAVGPTLAEPDAIAPAAATLPGIHRRILIADDNEDAAESLSVLLQMMGAEVRTAYDGLDAMKEALAFRPDMALLDIGMPRLNGHEVAQRIRAEPWGKGVVLVALTGWGQEEDKRRSMTAGFDHHFTKPVDPERIEALLADLQSQPSRIETEIGIRA